MKFSILTTILFCLLLFFTSCTSVEEKEPVPEWQQNQIKVINEFFADKIAGNEAKNSYCPGDGIINSDIFGIQSWAIVDSNGTSQQVGRFDVQINFDRDGEKSSEVWTITLFRLSEDAFDYCVYKIVPTESNGTK
ncbi:MAG: hypothetical protein HY819_18820 [Acidobacteria bacterium]|nr:hypothetical protein [Acidobacteriota bacterium]